MFKNVTLAAAALAMGAGALVPAAADAQRYYGDRYGRYEQRYDQHYRGDRYYDGRGARNWRNRGDARCDNLGGTVIGAIAGGLLGRTVDRHGDRTVGTVGGALLGGLAGREIARSDNPGYCRRR